MTVRLLRHTAATQVWEPTAVGNLLICGTLLRPPPRRDLCEAPDLLSFGLAVRNAAWALWPTALLLPPVATALAEDLTVMIPVIRSCLEASGSQAEHAVPHDTVSGLGFAKSESCMQIQELERTPCQVQRASHCW